MAHVHLLRALPKAKRNIQKRAEAKDPEVIATAKQYGEMYWDGPREYGYGGYRDDGRWHPVARDIIAAGMRAGDGVPERLLAGRHLLRRRQEMVGFELGQIRRRMLLVERAALGGGQVPAVQVGREPDAGGTLIERRDAVDEVVGAILDPRVLKVRGDAVVRE